MGAHLALKVCVFISGPEQHVRFTPPSRIGPLRAAICPRSQPGALIEVSLVIKSCFE
jgi:hypothetical protein